jgi:hypothetical protein
MRKGYKKKLKKQELKIDVLYWKFKKCKNVETKEMHFSAIILWKLSCLRSSLSTTEKHEKH